MVSGCFNKILPIATHKFLCHALFCKRYVHALFSTVHGYNASYFRNKNIDLYFAHSFCIHLTITAQLLFHAQTSSHCPKKPEYYVNADSISNTWLMNVMSN